MHVCFPWCWPKCEKRYMTILSNLVVSVVIHTTREWMYGYVALGENIMCRWFSRLNNCYTNVNVKDNCQFFIGLFPLKTLHLACILGTVNLSDLETRFRIIALQSLASICVSPHSLFNVPPCSMSTRSPKSHCIVHFPHNMSHYLLDVQQER